MILNPGSLEDRRALGLDTRRRRHIANEEHEPWPPSVMTARRDRLLRSHSGFRNRSLDARYNCMGMVFAARRTWVDPDQFRLIVEDDGYRRVGAEERKEVGDVVVYLRGGSVEHVGVVTGLRPGASGAGLEVLSQFGPSGEYFHDADEIPEFLRIGGKLDLEVWTDRGEP